MSVNKKPNYYCRSEQRRIQDHLAKLSGGSLDQASQEEEEEQEDKKDCFSNKDDDEAKNEEVEDDGEEGQGQEERDNNSLVTRGADTVSGHGTPNDVAGAPELSVCPTIRKSNVTNWN